MVRQREETKKQLDAKFTDINRNKDFTISEKKRLDDTLRAFESKFNYQLKSMRDTYEKKIGAFRDINKKILGDTKARVDGIEEALLKEKEDR